MFFRFKLIFRKLKKKKNSWKIFINIFFKYYSEFYFEFLGVPMDEKKLNGEDFEEELMMAIMKETTVVQKAIYR